MLKRDVAYRIHPAVGVARVGDSKSFYLAPVEVGGLPIECNPRTLRPRRGDPYVTFFKEAGRIRRQAAVFGVYEWRDGAAKEIDYREFDLEWTVHLANKKAAWYKFEDQRGFERIKASIAGKPLSARRQHLRNPDTLLTAERRKFIFDPGPRTLGPGTRAVSFEKKRASAKYLHPEFPRYTDSDPVYGDRVESLGEARRDADGRLLVIGAKGLAGGNEALSGDLDGKAWYDDTCDGSVLCRIRRDGRLVAELEAWCIVCPPAFAPELVNIVTLDDLMFDIAVRYQNMLPGLGKAEKRQLAGVVNPETEVEKIVRRFQDVLWVSDLTPLLPFAGLDVQKMSRKGRRSFARYVRRDANVLWRDRVHAQLPQNAGDNNDWNVSQVKFLTFTPTTLSILDQWVAGRTGKVDVDLECKSKLVHPLDRAAVANCVGGPLAPSIEVTWSLRYAHIYKSPWRIKHRETANGRRVTYERTGLSPYRDETDLPKGGDGGGCEPGDLTKRMSLPWQADLYGCTYQTITFNDKPNVTADGLAPPPTYALYWWPPQAPVRVTTFERTEDLQVHSGAPVGVRLDFARGVNSYMDAVAAWRHLGIVRDVSALPRSNSRPRASNLREYPLFVELERNHAEFIVAAASVGSIGNVVSAGDLAFSPVFFLREPLRVRRSIAKNFRREAHAIRHK